MNLAPQNPAPRRRIWRWVGLGLGLCLAPWVLLAIIAASYWSLDRNAAALRKQVMAATDASWNTKVQLSVGGVTLGAVRTGLSFVQHRHIDDARLALAAVQYASVGVYERDTASGDWSREQLFLRTDHAMEKRGWTRLAGVADKQDTVLVYVPQDLRDNEPVEICVAVVSGKELVVVSTSVNAEKLAELVEKHAGGEMKRHMKLAKLGL